MKYHFIILFAEAMPENTVPAKEITETIVENGSETLWMIIKIIGAILVV